MQCTIITTDKRQYHDQIPQQEFEYIKDNIFVLINLAGHIIKDMKD